MKALLLLALVGAVSAFRPTRGLHSQVSFARFAKGKGFGKAPAPATTSPVASTTETTLIAEETTTAKKTSGASNDDIDAILQKYGVKDDKAAKARAKAKADSERGAKGKDAPFGEGIIAKLDTATQQKFDNILITGVSISLGFVILCGIGISAGAIEVVFKDITIPDAMDSFITNFLTPAFTPALGVFFFFSITVGLFKFAQISSDQTVYREP
jgi:hypothetical protein